MPPHMLRKWYDPKRTRKHTSKSPHQNYYWMVGLLDFSHVFFCKNVYFGVLKFDPYSYVNTHHHFLGLSWTPEYTTNLPHIHIHITTFWTPDFERYCGFHLGRKTQKDGLKQSCELFQGIPLKLCKIGYVVL